MGRISQKPRPPKKLVVVGYFDARFCLIDLYGEFKGTWGPISLQDIEKWITEMPSCGVPEQNEVPEGFRL